ncbi:nSTAND1 domain-containing NTPase [Sorangium sp. So ce131]|uniref:serine/threonine-protein kinase n=1 Tax=Sorangium sp. So ce131 TaxID=3133282 RepID=UPI003F5D581E
MGTTTGRPDTLPDPSSAAPLRRLDAPAREATVTFTAGAAEAAPEGTPAARSAQVAGEAGRTEAETRADASPRSRRREAEDPPASIGKFVGHYEVIRELGRGGMGRVVVARDTRLGRLVAIKFLSRLSEARVQRFLVEARATARCKHENIVTLHEVSEHGGYPYMVLEYIEGQSLRAWMDQRRPADAGEEISTAPVPPSLAVEMMAPVVRALACAHKFGIVHRDLKPENIMLDASGPIKVLDFGIAKLREDDASPARPAPRAPLAGEPALTREGAIMGTMPYMSPEQWRGEGIDACSDLWAVGVLLYELVTGAHPLAPPHMGNLMRVAELDEPMPRVDDGRPELGAIGAVIDRCLRKRKEERFASAQELLSELTRALPGRHEVVLGADESPFAGLSSFQEIDADRFFGRGQEIAGVVSRLRSQPLLAVVGASGAGKSSLVRAGVIPALKRSGEGWDALIIRPGREPMAAVADLFSHPSVTLLPELRGLDPQGGAAARAALNERLRAEPGYLGTALRAWSARERRRLLLFVDQFEELYTQGCDAGERGAFLSCLAGVADDASSPLRVILAMRSDFLERAAEDQHFMVALTRGLVFLPAIGRAGLREALVMPVRAARYEIEDPGMVEGILDTLATTRGALPLLQFTAARLWDTRDRERRLLTRASYQAIGGVAGTLASHADTVLAGMSARHAKLARTIFERLVTPERTRAIASLSELRELPGGAEEIERVIHLLADARLLAMETGGGSAGSTVEIVHESLIDSWPTLHRWLDENQEDAAYLDKLRAAAKQWESSGRADDMLWRGKIAEDARRFRERYHGEVMEREQRYLDAVLRLADTVHRRKRALIYGTIAALSFLVVAATVGIIKVQNQNRVITEQLQEIRQTEENLQKALAAEKLARDAAERARKDIEAQREQAKQMEQMQRQREAERAREEAAGGRGAARKVRGDGKRVAAEAAP